LIYAQLCHKITEKRYKNAQIRKKKPAHFIFLTEEPSSLILFRIRILDVVGLQHGLAVVVLALQAKRRKRRADKARI
jgi:hypothetical protein